MLYPWEMSILDGALAVWLKAKLVIIGNTSITGDLDVSGKITADEIPIENLSDVDKQSFENLLDNGDFKSWPAGGSSAPGEWIDDGLSAVDQEATIKKIGSYSAKCTPNGVYDKLYQRLTDEQVLQYAGRYISVGCWVHSSTADSARLNLSDSSGNSYSSFHTGGGDQEWLTVTRLIDAAPTHIQFSLYPDNTNGTAIAYFDGAILVEGPVCPAFSPKPLSFIGWESKEIFLNENVSNIANKPSLIDIGLFKAYSLPEYAAGEELLFSMRVPHDWDATTNPYFVCPSILTAAEDIGDKYKFQIEWQSADVGGVFPVTTQETITHEVTVTDGTQYRGEILAFELDATTLVRGQNLQLRLRRIAASSLSVSNEIAIPHWDTRWKLNKLGTESIQGY